MYTTPPTEIFFHIRVYVYNEKRYVGGIVYITVMFDHLSLVSLLFAVLVSIYILLHFQCFLSRHRSAETQCWMRRYVRTWYVRGTYVAFRNAPAQVLHACSTPLIGCQTYLLGECRTLWGEPERVHAGAECAWSSCMC